MKIAWLFSAIFLLLTFFKTSVFCKSTKTCETKVWQLNTKYYQLIFWKIKYDISHYRSDERPIMKSEYSFKYRNQFRNKIYISIEGNKVNNTRIQMIRWVVRFGVIIICKIHILDDLLVTVIHALECSTINTIA